MSSGQSECHENTTRLWTAAHWWCAIPTYHAALIRRGLLVTRKTTFSLIRCMLLSTVSAQNNRAASQCIGLVYTVITIKACPHCRRKVRQSPNFAVVSRRRAFSATVALFCDSVDRLYGTFDSFNNAVFTRGDRCGHCRNLIHRSVCGQRRQISCQ